MSNLTLWTRRDPFAEFDAIVRSAFGPTARHNGFVPAAEVLREGQDAVVRVELPGVDVAKDVNVELADGRLAIHGERRDERSEETSGYSLREVRYGTFRRAFTVPRHITADALSADYKDGVLTVRVTGAYAETEPSRITIAAA